MLRVGCFVRESAFQEWQARCVESFREVAGVLLALVILVDEPADRARHSPRRSRALRPASLDRTIGDAARLRCRPRVLEDGRRVLAAADIDEVRRHDLDVLVDLAKVPFSGAILTTPRFGVWAFHHADPALYEGGAPGFWEVYNDTTYTICQLHRLTADPGAVIPLVGGRFKTLSTYRRNCDSVLLRSTRFCARALREILSGETGTVTGAAVAIPSGRTGIPNAAEYCWLGVRRAVSRHFLLLFRLSRRERWMIGIARIGLEEVIRQRRLGAVEWLKDQPTERFFADPFLLEQAGDRLTLLVEDYRYSRAKGHITAIEVSPDRTVTKATDCIRSEHHLSYPFVLRVGNDLFCIPESAQSNRVTAFRRDPTTGHWRYHATLIEGIAAVDPTLVQYGDKWWLFCMDRRDHVEANLYLFLADDCLGPWRPHPLNPVKCDVGSSRPAGNLFIVDGELYRPAQDCSRRYGGALAINRILELTARTFREETVFTLVPWADGPCPAGLHTINAGDGITIVDGLALEFVPRMWARAALRRLFRRQ